MTHEAGRPAHVDSLTPRILVMNEAGVRSVDIAHRLNCSRANVCQALRRHKRKSAAPGGRPKKALPGFEAATECPIPPEPEAA